MQDWEAFGKFKEEEAKKSHLEAKEKELKTALCPMHKPKHASKVCKHCKRYLEGECFGPGSEDC